MILTDLTEKELVEYRGKFIDIAYDIEYDNNFDVEINPLLKNIDKVNYWLEALPFYMNIQKEDIVLYEFRDVYNKA